MQLEFYLLIEVLELLHTEVVLLVLFAQATAQVVQTHALQCHLVLQLGVLEHGLLVSLTQRCKGVLLVGNVHFVLHIHTFTHSHTEELALADMCELIGTKQGIC